jgi:Na+/phosphate symporter
MAGISLNEELQKHIKPLIGEFDIQYRHKAHDKNEVTISKSFEIHPDNLQKTLSHIAEQLQNLFKPIVQPETNKWKNIVRKLLRKKDEQIFQLQSQITKLQYKYKINEKDL